jgi:hypothetical protein
VKPSQHVEVSLGSGVVLGLLTQSWISGLACALMGTLIDLDHYVDFWVNRGFSLSPRRFFDFCYHGSSRKFYDLLHGYEFIPLWWGVTALPGLEEWGLGLTVGYTLHLLCDQFFNTHLNRWTYFFTYRLIHRFEASKIVLYHPFQRESRQPGV